MSPLNITGEAGGHENPLKRQYPFQDDFQSRPSQPLAQVSSSNELLDADDPQLNHPEQVCFGCVGLPVAFRVLWLIFVQIVGGTAQFVEDGYQAAQNLARTNSKVQPLSVGQEGKFFCLQSNGAPLARLNKALGGLLETLFNERSCHAVAYIQTNELQRDEIVSGNSSTISLEINIYGCRTDAERVGRCLSSSGIYLQYPRYGIHDYRYYNPHIFRVEGFSDQVQFESQEPSRGQTSLNSGPDVGEESTETVSTVVSSILDGLTHNVLANVQIDSRIKSTLLK